MRLTYSIAQIIVNQTTDLLGCNVSVADQSGLVLASGDQRQVGRFCPPVVHVVATSEPLEVHIGDEGESGIGEAMVLPLPYEGEQIGAIIVHDQLERCRATARVVQALAELLAHQTTVIEQLPQQKELKDKFIHDLLHHPIDDEATVLRLADILQMDLRVPRAVILVDAADFILNGSRGPTQLTAIEPQLRVRRNTYRVVQSIVKFFNLPTDTICGYIGDGRIAVLKAVDPGSLRTWTAGNGREGWGGMDLAALKRAAHALLQRLQQDTGQAINVGVGRYYPGLSGLAKSYRDAAAAIELGRRLAGCGRVHALDNLGIAAFVGPADQRTKVDLAGHLLRPLEDEPELLHTLEAFFADDCRPLSVAEQLAVHRNTLAYRLDKISDLTGLDPRRFDDAVQLRLALLLRNLA
jgi:carbohydrate diacid regulator